MVFFLSRSFEQSISGSVIALGGEFEIIITYMVINIVALAPVVVSVAPFFSSASGDSRRNWP